MRKIDYEFKKDNFLNENESLKELEASKLIERLLEKLEIFAFKLNLAKQEQKYIDKVNNDIKKIEKLKNVIIKNLDFLVYESQEKIYFNIYI